MAKDPHDSSLLMTRGSLALRWTTGSPLSVSLHGYCTLIICGTNFFFAPGCTLKHQFQIIWVQEAFLVPLHETGSVKWGGSRPAHKGMYWWSIAKAWVSLQGRGLGHGSDIARQMGREPISLGPKNLVCKPRSVTFVVTRGCAHWVPLLGHCKCSSPTWSKYCLAEMVIECGWMILLILMP